MKKQYLVIELNDPTFNYIVDNLKQLIEEMYECELMNGESIDEVNSKFYSCHLVYEVEGTIVKK